MKIFLSTFLFFTLPVLAQNKNDFSIEYGVNRIAYKMTLPQQYIEQDTTYKFYHPTSAKDRMNNLNQGVMQTLAIHYQPWNYLDIGLVGSFQKSRFIRTYSFLNYFDPDENGDFPVIHGSIVNKCSSTTLGLSSNLYLNKLFHFEEKKSANIRKIIVATSVTALFGFNEFSEVSGNELYNADERNFKYSTKVFHLQSEINLGYQIFRDCNFSTIGLKLGYQFLTISTLKDFAGVELPLANDTETNVSLNFSGLYYGVYIRFGK